jgi:hypothetical protein
MQRKFRVLSAVTAGSLALTVVAISVNSGTSQTAKQAAFAAQTASFPPVNLDNCPVLHTGYPRGGCVAQLQTDLDSIPGYDVDVDGLFGSKTYSAVLAFQGAHGLKQDGMVGRDTKRALDAALSVPTPTLPTATAPGPGTSTTSPAPGTSTVGPTPGTSTVGPTLGTAGSSGMAKYTRMAHSFFGDRACISGYCAPLGQSWLWYDSTDSSGHDLRRIQLNWGYPEIPCSTWVDFDAWSTSGSIRYWHIQGDTHTGCRLRDTLYAQWPCVRPI